MTSPILVSGAGGFIGSHLVETLARRGRAVRALVRYGSSGSAGWLDGLAPDLQGAVEIVRGDVRDYDSVRTAMAGCSGVAHLAALIAIPYSYEAPRSYVDTNVTGTLNVLQAARDLGGIRVVQTSTSEVYGSARFVPITEEHPLNAQSPYAASKIAADQLALSFHRSFGLPVTVLRPFNTYGPRQSARAVIPTIIAQALSGARAVTLGALHPTRDLTFVEDIARAFIAALDCDAAIGHVVQAGSNFEISVADIVKTIARVIGTNLEVVADSRRVRPEASEVDRLWADNTMAAALLAWKPKYGGLDGFERGIARTVEWFSIPANLSRYRAGKYQL